MLTEVYFDAVAAKPLTNNSDKAGLDRVIKEEMKKHKMICIRSRSLLLQDKIIPRNPSFVLLWSFKMTSTCESVWGKWKQISIPTTS